MKGKVIQVRVRDLQTKFDVRKKLNEDNVLNMAMMYEAGAALPPILITKQMVIIDGRHRKAALELANRLVADCIISDETNEAEQMVLALKSNVGGPLPPSREDINHTILLLFNQGWSQRKIKEALPFPPSVGQKYIDGAWSTILEQKLRLALKAIAEDGITVPVAAAKFGVPESKLKEHLNPNRKRQKQKTLGWRKNHISRAYQGWHRKVAYEIQTLSNAYEDNEISEDDVQQVFEHIFDLIEKGKRRVESHRERFANTARELSKVGEIELESSRV